MAFDRASTSLGFIEDKLRKMLGLAGTIGAKFNADPINPVIIGGDIRDPGYASFRGRKWIWNYSVDAIAPSAANDTYGLSWAVPVVIRAIACVGLQSVNSNCMAHMIAPDDALLTNWGGGNRATGTWTDQKNLAAEQTPLLDRALRVSAGMAIGSPHLSCIGQWRGYGTNVGMTPALLPVVIHAPANAAILFQPALAAGDFCRFAVHGEVF